jgi:bifunctional DNA-binding transcriptional regulator/antitoxin component of YhaV-PrlF toxin-antitoxin module
MKSTWATRYVKVGNSQCIIVPKEVREKLGAVPGDLIIMRMFGRLLICRKLDPNQIVDVNELPADALPSAVRG